MNKLLFAMLWAINLFVVTGCQAEPKESFQAGEDYYVLSEPVRTSDPNKIEVAEVFWYGCPHCYHYYKDFAAWGSKLPDDVVYVRNPATLGHRRAEVHTRAYYTAEAMGVLDTVHPLLFAAYHDKKQTLANQREIGDVFVAAGVDRDEFDRTFNSFGMISKSRQAEARATGYRITGTPCLVVNGKYRITGESAGGNKEMMAVAEFLIAQERKAPK